MTDMVQRRDLLSASVLMAAASLPSRGADAAGADPAMTQVVQADAIPWRQLYNFPPGTAEQATLHGGLHEPGQYFVLIRWHPGYMSAPHSYETDRLCIVLSGTWWVASGTDFAPGATVPVEAGGFVRRVAGTPHYDGVKKHADGPAILAISGIGPIHFSLVDPHRPGWREV
ncbi:cupin domain-containing protein [Lichenicoccus sp.]|uniref:cupin domain-containing protein n=1 Tax=Lichenicoccus sp. TaxID=2781899 RepID=UPI003D0A5022